MQQYTHENVKSIPHLPIYCDQYETYRQMSPSHWHDHLEIIYVLEGELQVTNDETVYTFGENGYTLCADEFYVINSSKIHGTKSSGRVKALLIQIPYSYLDSYIDDYSHVRFEECYQNEHGKAEYIQMKKLLRAVAHIYQNKEKGYELRLMAKLNEFIYILYTNYSHIEKNVEKESKQIARLKDVLQYVAESYQEPVSLKTAAEMVSLNQEYFCRMFKRCMGVTFLEYINLVRIDHIHEELLVTDDSITDILQRNGFTNYKVFSRMFKEQFGMTPRELRKLK
ncbi:helix-turn-helix domain-containing protein [Agathobacter sp.]